MKDFSSPSTGTRLLSGYRVVELGDPAAMFAGKLLGDMGCDVLRVERPGADAWRGLPPLVPWGKEQLSALWVAYNTSKRSVALDVECASGRELLDKLLDAADIAIVSGAPQWMQANRLRPEDFRSPAAAQRRKLVAAAISPFGLEGPRRGFEGSDLIVQAAGGMLFLNGNEDRPPVRISEETSWAQAGSQASFAATAALFSAQRDGVGESIDVSAQEAIVAALVNITPWWQHARRIKRRKTHSGYTDVSIPTIFPCKDGFVCFRVSLGKGQGLRTKRLIDWMAEEGQDDGLKDVNWETISTLTLKQDVADSYSSRIENFFRTRTRAELYAGARPRHVLLFPVMELSDMPGDRQMIERNFFTALADPDGRRVQFPGALFRVTGAGLDNAGPSPAAPPRPAQDTAAVLAEFAGLEPAQFEKLRSQGVVA